MSVAVVLMAVCPVAWCVQVKRMTGVIGERVVLDVLSNFKWVNSSTSDGLTWTMKDDPALAVNTVKTDQGLAQHVLFDFSIDIRLHYIFRFLP